MKNNNIQQKEEALTRKFTIIVVIAIAITAIVTAVIVKKAIKKEYTKSLTPMQQENIERVGQDLKEYYMNKYK